MTAPPGTKPPYRMLFDAGTIKHLGLQMYSTLPPVISELVANGWDANATRVEITIPETRLDSPSSEIVIADNGIGMSDFDVRKKYVITGRDRRDNEQTDESPEPYRRKIMGRKGIGKFSSFGIAKEIEIESIRDGDTSRFVMNYDQMMERADDRDIEFDALPATGEFSQGTRITLREFTRFKTRCIQIAPLRRRLARRFSVIGSSHDFEVIINGLPITAEERDLQALLDKDAAGKPYLWTYDPFEVKPETGWYVSGWIGALNRTSPSIDGVDRGIALMARGKLVQEPFLFDAVVGQQYALSYIVGELHVEFVDAEEDTIGTNRNTLVWDADANQALKEWGQSELNKVARQWGDKRKKDKKRELERNPQYRDFKQRAVATGNRRAMSLADKLVLQTIDQNPADDIQKVEPIIKMCLDFLEFDVFWEIVDDLTDADLGNVNSLLQLFREWQVVEAKEMSRITEGRIATITKLQELIDQNALEVPTLHKFLKDFPWVIDPTWTLVADEITYTKLLRRKFPDDHQPEQDRRIDFLCVSSGGTLAVVEIKRPASSASIQELDQIEEYTNFMRHHLTGTTDPDFGTAQRQVNGYLLCGRVVNTFNAHGKRDNLAKAGIYVRQYSELLARVLHLHQEFMERYEQLKASKSQGNEDA